MTRDSRAAALPETPKEAQPEGRASGAEGNRPNPLILLPLLGESKMIQADNLIERPHLAKLHEFQCEHTCFVTPKPGGSILEWAAAELVETRQRWGDASLEAQELRLDSLRAEKRFGNEVARLTAEKRAAEREAEKLRELLRNPTHAMKEAGARSIPTAGAYDIAHDVWARMARQALGNQR